MPKHWSWNACRAVDCNHLRYVKQEGKRARVEACKVIYRDEPDLCPLVQYCLSEGCIWTEFKEQQLRIRDAKWKARVKA